MQRINNCKKGNYLCGGRCVPNHWKCGQNRKNEITRMSTSELKTAVINSVINNDARKFEELIREYKKRGDNEGFN